MALRIVHLLEPDLCTDCRFAKIERRMGHFGVESMIRCTRRDCDNWDNMSSEQVAEEQEDDE